MQFEDWCRVLDSAWSLGCRRLQFIGGEPTVHPDLIRLLEHAYAVGFQQCMVSTNATRLSDDLLELLELRRVRVSISFYSADAEVHDRITGRAGSFVQTISGIQSLVARRIPIQAGIIVMDENDGSEKEARKLLRGLGVRFIGTDRVRSVGRGRHYFDAAAAPGDQLCGSCWNRRLCVTPTGDAYPCTFSRFTRVGNVLKESLRDVVEGGYLGAFRRASYLGEKGG